MKNLKYFTFISIFVCFLLSCENGNNPSKKTFTVIFDEDNGTMSTTQVINEGDKITEPIIPIKIYDVAGLYEGMPLYIFDGWYNNNTKWDFNISITRNITLKAKWILPNITPVDLSTVISTATGRIIDHAVCYLKENNISSAYTLLIDNDEIHNSAVGGSSIMYNNFNLTIIGIGEERTITEFNDYTLFRIYNGQSLTIGQNINLVNRVSDYSSLIVYSEGNFTMKKGSKITISYYVGILTGFGGHFIMEGGEIINNGGLAGVYIDWDSAFTMNEGKIIGNSTVWIESDSTFILSGNGNIDSILIIKGGIILHSNWIGSIEYIDLLGEIDSWESTVIIKGTSDHTLTSLDINKFPLGIFRNNSQPIRDTHELVLDSINNVIKIEKK